MKARGINVRPGDTIGYVICQTESSGLAEKAFSVDEMQRNGLKIDMEWYIKQQVHPPISRLCQHIEGTDSARLADCLGNILRYHVYSCRVGCIKVSQA